MTKEILRQSLVALFDHLYSNFRAKEGSQPEFEKLLTEVIGAATKLEQPVQPAQQVCAEVYQVVGTMLCDLGQFGTDRSRKVLDNLSACKLVHDDVLPWPSFAQPAEPDQRLLNLLARIHRDGGQYVAEHGIDQAIMDTDLIVAEMFAAQPEPVAEVHPNHLRPHDGTGEHWCREVLLYSGGNPGDLLNGKNYRVKLYTAPPAQPYDQTALELCNVCGWKTLIPGDGCLNCERDKAQPVQPAPDAAFWAVFQDLMDACDRAISKGYAWDGLSYIMDALDAAQPPTAQPVQPAITLDFRQATDLLAMFGGEPASVTLRNVAGHSGQGIYAHYTEIPEEGAEYLGMSDEEAAPDPIAQPARCPACNGDDRQAPCAYPEGGQTGCLRDARLARSVPLTDANIRSIWMTTDTGEVDDDVLSFARAIERAHGITGGGK